jgi:hypothetical protein
MESLLFIKRKLKATYSIKKKCDANIYYLITLNLALGLIITLSILNRFVQINEYISFIILACISSFILFGFLFYLFLRIQPLKNYSEIAEQIEQKTRVFQDSLNTTANFLDQKKTNFSNIELALIGNTSGLVLYNLSQRFLIPKSYRKWMPILTGTLIIFLFVLYKNNTFTLKGFNGYKDWLGGTNTYFKVEPGNFKTRNGSTVKIIAELTREEVIGGPVFISIKYDKSASEKVLMRHLGKNVYEANIYDVQENFKYVISNYNSASSNYKISVFEIPEIKSKEILIEPPGYTKLPIKKLTEFEYIAVPENSRIQIKVTTNKPSKVYFNAESKKSIFTEEDILIYSFLFRVANYTEYSLFLTDDEKHEFETNPNWIIETIPDLPPSADIKEPANDKKLLGIEELDIKYTLTDDYGISKAQLIIQTPKEGMITLPLSVKETSNEKMVSVEGEKTIPLLNLDLQNGDMISYYIKVWDNKEVANQDWGNKEAGNQVNVSTVKFLSIVPGKIKNKDEPPKDGQGKDFRIDDLIAELKRIYRGTIPLQYEKDANVLADQSIIYANALGDLKTATTLRLGQLSEIAGGQIPPEINELFEMAAYHTGDAEKAMRDKSIVQAIQSELVALQKLYQLSKLLEKDAQQTDKPSDDPSESKPNDKKDDKKKDDKNKSEELKAKIQKMLDKLETIKEKNTGVNNQAGKTSDILTEDEKKYFSEKKKQLKKEMQDATVDLQTNQELFPIADNVNNAIRENTNEEYNFAKGQKQNAIKHSIKTDFFLNQAIQQLKAMKKEMEASVLQQSQKSVSDMIKKQNEIKDKTQKENNPDKLADLAKEQEKLKEDLKNLEKQIREAIQKTEASSPQASNELEKSLQKLNKDNLDQKIGKASKSIFYGLKDKSQLEQNSIVKSLENIKEQIQSAQEKMSDADKQQLMNALAQLSQIKDKSNESSEKQKAEEIKSALEDIGGSSTPQFLKDTVKIAEQIKNSNGKNNVGITSDQLLMEAMTLIERKLKSMEMTDQVRKKMNMQMPPEVYKRMVEEYFQNLSKKNQ